MDTSRIGVSLFTQNNGTSRRVSREHIENGRSPLLHQSDEEENLVNTDPLTYGSNKRGY